MCCKALDVSGFPDILVDKVVRLRYTSGPYCHPNNNSGRILGLLLEFQLVERVLDVTRVVASVNRGLVPSWTELLFVAHYNVLVTVIQAIDQLLAEIFGFLGLSIGILSVFGRLRYSTLKLVSWFLMI